MQKSLFSVIFISLSVLFFSGCSRTSLPATDIMEKEIMGFELPKLPEEGKAIVYVVRPEVLGGLIKFNVYIDDKEPSSEMGYTQGQEYIYFNLKPGKHTILSLAENWDKVQVDVKAGDIIFIEQEAKMGVVYARNKLHMDYANDLLAGKYRVKTLTLGTIIKLDK